MATIFTAPVVCYPHSSINVHSKKSSILPAFPPSKVWCLHGGFTLPRSDHGVLLPFFQTLSSSRYRTRVCSASEPAPFPSTTGSDTPAPKPAAPLKKGQIVRVDKEKYLNSVEYLAVGHPLNYKGIDYIYEDRGEILEIRQFETGEYALISWVGVPSSPAWLPTYMLIKSEKLSYRRT